MNYIKQNKIFMLLVSIMSLCILFLCFQLLQPKSTSPTASNPEDSNEKTTIDSFNIGFNPQLQITFNWSLSLGKESIEEMMIYHGEELIADVSKEASYTLNYLDHTISTGNEMFTFRVTLGDGSTIERQAYVYIKEAFDFQVSEERQGGKILYEISYYYDKNKAVKAPKALLKGNQNYSFPFAYERSETLEEKGQFVKVKHVYTLDVSGAPSGNYSLDYIWMFVEFNLEYTTSSSFQI